MRGTQRREKCWPEKEAGGGGALEMIAGREGKRSDPRARNPCLATKDKKEQAGAEERKGMIEKEIGKGVNIASPESSLHRVEFALRPGERKGLGRNGIGKGLPRKGEGWEESQYGPR